MRSLFTKMAVAFGLTASTLAAPCGAHQPSTEIEAAAVGVTQEAPSRAPERPSGARKGRQQKDAPPTPPTRGAEGPPPPPGNAVAPLSKDRAGNREVGGSLVQVEMAEIKHSAVQARENFATTILESHVIEWQEELSLAVESGDKYRVLNAVRGLGQSYRWFLRQYADLQGPIDDARKLVHSGSRRINEYVAERSEGSRIDRKRQLAGFDRQLDELALRIHETRQAGGDPSELEASFQRIAEVKEITASIERQLGGAMGLEQTALQIRAMFQGLDEELVYFEHILNLAQTSLQGEVELLELSEAAIELAIVIEGSEAVLDAEELKEMVGGLVEGRGVLNQALRDITGNARVRVTRSRPQLDQKIDRHIQRALARKSTQGRDPNQVALDR
ncbi:MAG: hypothetical protein AAF726_18570 [Planctomycetota bacterium]